ncbi:hypothetical protein Pelo_4622 [Pelomyxa schiedti]|nr:hypothetical protein Pelo_4622 [Pelomyxa schiedti]
MQQPVVTATTVAPAPPPIQQPQWVLGLASGGPFTFSPPSTALPAVFSFPTPDPPAPAPSTTAPPFGTVLLPPPTTPPALPVIPPQQPAQQTKRGSNKGRGGEGGRSRAPPSAASSSRASSAPASASSSCSSGSSGGGGSPPPPPPHVSWRKYALFLQSEAAELRRTVDALLAEREEQQSQPPPSAGLGLGGCAVCAVRKPYTEVLTSCIQKLHGTASSALDALDALNIRCHDLAEQLANKPPPQQQQQNPRLTLQIPLSPPTQSQSQPQAEQKTHQTAIVGGVGRPAPPDQFPRDSTMHTMMAAYRNTDFRALLEQLKETGQVQLVVLYTNYIFEQVSQAIDKYFMGLPKEHHSVLFSDSLGKQIIAPLRSQGTQFTEEMEFFCQQIYNESKFMVLRDPQLTYDTPRNTSGATTVQLILPAVIEGVSKQEFYPAIPLPCIDPETMSSDH